MRYLTASVLACFALACDQAGAASAQPVMRLFPSAASTAAPGGTTHYFVTAENAGNQATNGEPLSLRATLPAGLTATSVSGQTLWDCSGTSFPTTVVNCILNEALEPRNTRVLPLSVGVDPSASGVLTSSFAISGGGAADFSTVNPTRVSALAPSFGVDGFDAQVFGDAAGSSSSQAAGHPFSVTTSMLFNTIDTPPIPILGEPWPVEPTKDVAVNLPAGFVVDPSATGGVRCATDALATHFGSEQCPPGAQVGTVRVTTTGGTLVGDALPVFNMVAPPGVPARLAFNIQGTVVSIDGSVRSDGDYGFTGTVHNAPEAIAVSATTLTLWGVPADPSHENERSCPGKEIVSFGGPGCSTDVARRPLLRNPAACTAPGVGLTTTLSIDSWFHPGVFKEASSTSHNLPGFPADPSEWGAPVGITGCGQVPFSPSLTATPDEPAAGAPSGYHFNISVPQSEDPTAIGEADVKKIAVTLPEGVQVSPSSANGLGACSEGQIGFLGGGFPEPNPTHFNEADPSCPENSKLGEVEVTTPLLEEPLKGAAYLASPNENPFGSLLAMYLVVKGPGVIVKLPGLIQADPNTGRLTATFDHNPQVPVSSVKVALKNGPRASLMNPPGCGTYATVGQFSSWAEPDNPLVSSSPMQITTNANGEACAPQGFAPVFLGGSTATQAGGFSPLVLSFSRNDTDQQFRGLSQTLAPGSAAVLAGVPQCSGSDAATGSCPSSSRIGSVTVAAGAGPHPFFLKGQVFLTGPYKGAPFGEAVVVPADAGPFHLGNVVVRGSIRIDPHTAQATVISDPFPQYVNGTGIPTDVRRVDVVLDRPGFAFNPTNCGALAMSATLSSTQGVSAALSTPFHASGCRSLRFHPDFKVSTSGKTSKANGASLHVHLETHDGPAGGEANIAKVNVELPGVLPSRLTTLQKACSESQFNADPAGCPQASFVGSAVAHTPILSSSLSGPAILVSHGGAAFPDLVVVLQGEGIRIDLIGNTQIVKGHTFSRFNTIPDAPVSSFDLTLPQGPRSALAAAANLCHAGKTITVRERLTRKVHGRTIHTTAKVKRFVPEALLMPTTITAQNGARLNQNTKIAITGCAQAKAGKRGRSHR
jgi:hypothetical protein